MALGENYFSNKNCSRQSAAATYISCYIYVSVCDSLLYDLLYIPVPVA